VDRQAVEFQAAGEPESCQDLGMSHWVTLAAVLGALGVAAGAFGAHGLQGRVDPALLSAFDTGARYHLVHAIALLIVALIETRAMEPRNAGAVRPPSSRWLRGAAWLFTSGIVLFSGSLYALALTGERWMGAITPLGGVALIAGWTALAVGSTTALRSQ
jgi:uncharacterized membrane protein YgdD (TMEM256/DUF423 family)